MTTPAQIAAGNSAAEVQNTNYRLGLTTAQVQSAVQAVADATDNRGKTSVQAITDLHLQLTSAQVQGLADVIDQAFRDAA